MKGEENSHIDIFLRVKPVEKPSGSLLLEPNDGKVEFNCARTSSQGWGLGVVRTCTIVAASRVCTEEVSACYCILAVFVLS